MQKLLDLYRRRFGDAVKMQGSDYNGPCPLCGGTPGKSDRFMVWPEKNEKLGKVCTEHNITGVWYCRKCGKSGDTVQYLMDCEGMEFKEALAELGITPTAKGARPRRRVAPPDPRPVEGFEPKAIQPCSEAWGAYAEKIVEEGSSAIMHMPSALKWLAERGIDEDAVKAFRIGYLKEENSRYAGRYRARSALGLTPKIGQDGKERIRIFIPRGIVVPSMDEKGAIYNIRIRRPKPDLTGQSPKYLELEGSSRRPLFLKSSLPPQLAVYAIVEAELDAMLIHHATGGVVGAVAVRTNRGRPDKVAHEALQKAVIILIALDYDEAGRQGVEFWTKNYAAATRWPPPEGKDPGDAFALGVDIYDWMAEALPPSIQLPPKRLPSNGQTDHNAAGLNNWGDGGEDSSVHFFESLSARMQQNILAAMPDYWSVETVPVEVLKAFVLWQGVPITYMKEAGGFEWLYSYEWRRTYSEKFEAFFDYQDKCPVLWDWLSQHASNKINEKNLLKTRELRHDTRKRNARV